MHTSADSPSGRRIGTLLRHVLGGDESAAPGVVLRRAPTSAGALLPSQLSAADIPVLTRLLDHDNHEMRDAMKAFMKSDLYLPVRGSSSAGWRAGAPTVSTRHLTRAALPLPRAQRYDMPLRVERELALERLSQICAQRFFSVRKAAC